MRALLAACQVHVSAADYASADAFDALLARVGARLEAARAAAGARPDDACLAVFPELIGAFLPLADRALRARTVDDAFARVGRGLLPTLAATMLCYRLGSTKVALLLAVAPETWAIYRRAFSRFARRHRAWVVAGSALLPQNAYGDTADEFAPADGRVYNTSYTFAPDGRHVGATRKVNLVPTLEDVLGLSPGAADDVRPVDTPLGPIGTLVCYDGFAEPHTEKEPAFCPLVARLDALGCRVIAQPAANPWPWDQKWIFAAPGETQLRRDQWLGEGLLAQLGAARPRNVRYAVNPQLVGHVLDQRWDGTSYLFACGPDGARVVAQSARWDAVPEAEEVVARVVEL
jgi:predicted amidohydrolase